jgi:hypothetical protein
VEIGIPKEIMAGERRVALVPESAARLVWPARCDFYLPKGSTQAQLLEAKGNLQRMPGQHPADGRTAGACRCQRPG